jgi:translation initiation factor 2B subunit (eIF-2B alpha/beta/delta family)
MGLEKISSPSRIRANAIKTIRETVKKSRARRVSQFRKELRKTLLELLKNFSNDSGLRTLIRIVSMQALKRVESLSDLKWEIENVCDNYEKDRKFALNTIARYGSRLIKKNSIVLVHCQSHTVEAILKEAFKKGKIEKTIITETRPLFEGRLMAQSLAREGIPVTLIIDNAASLYLKDCDFFFTGVETILSDGSIANKIGTRQISLAAFKEDTPHYVAGSTHKFSPQSFYGWEKEIRMGCPKIVWETTSKNIVVENPEFDITEAKLIQGIVTEKGIFDSHNISMVLYKELNLEKTRESYLNLHNLLKELK